MNKELTNKYKELRKVLAEGKEIEYSITDLNGNHIRWVNILEQANSYNIDTKVFNYELSAYRIKPEEPKFKVGDWVRAPSGCIYQINETNILHGTEHFIPWQPKPGEWCWVGYKLMKFSKLIKEDYSTTFEFISPDRDADGHKIKKYILERHLQVVEPFIGQLPTFLKENT